MFGGLRLGLSSFVFGGVVVALSLRVGWWVSGVAWCLFGIVLICVFGVGIGWVLCVDIGCLTCSLVWIGLLCLV